MSADLYARIFNRYGKPTLMPGGTVVMPTSFAPNHMGLWLRPVELSWFPAPKIYINLDIKDRLTEVLRALRKAEVDHEVKTFDGCFNPRLVRGSTTAFSMHTWGIALDLNAKTNPLGGQVTFSKKFLQVWRDLGWTCGADFPRKDGMHFEYTRHL